MDIICVASMLIVLTYFLFEVSVITGAKRKFRKGRSLKKSRSSVMAELFWNIVLLVHLHTYTFIPSNFGLVY